MTSLWSLVFFSRVLNDPCSSHEQHYAQVYSQPHLCALANRSPDSWVNQSINQSTNQSINQSINQSVSQSISLLSQSISSSPNLCVNQLTDLRMHASVNLDIIGSNNCLSSVWRQDITWTISDWLPNGPSETNFSKLWINTISRYCIAGLILVLRPANERRCYFVTTSLISWAQA